MYVLLIIHQTQINLVLLGRYPAANLIELS